MTRILIIVEGGCIQSIVSTDPVEVLIKDFDNIKDGDRFDPDAWEQPGIMRGVHFRNAVHDGVEPRTEPFGHCDTCGALCDSEGCTAYREHEVAIS